MTDYSKYSYARTLQFFEAYYPYDTEKVNYAELMLSMNKLSTIDELISVRERIIGKYLDLEIVLCKLPKEICSPLAVGSYEDFGQSIRSVTALNQTIKQDVYDCYNTNIFRLFKNSKEPTLSFCGECIVNLSDFSDKYDKQIKRIVQYSKEVYNIDSEELSKEIISQKKNLRKIWSEYEDFEEGMNGYQSAKQKVIDSLDFILKYKWRPTLNDKELYSEFLPLEMRNIPENQNKEAEDSNTLLIISSIIGGILIGALIAWAGPLIFLFALFVGALLLKCMR